MPRTTRLVLLSFLLAACGHGRARVEGLPRLAAGEVHVTSGGVDIVVHVEGAGPVIVAHPGGPGAEWTYLRMPELEKSFTMVYVEPVGTGSSGRPTGPGDYRIERYVSDVEAVRERLGLERFILLGHSHGGFVAQAYALAHGDRLAGLILYDTSPTTGPEWQKDIEQNLSWFAAEPWYQEAVAALAQETSAKTDAEMTAVFHREAPLYFADYTHRRAELDPLIAKVSFSVAPSQGSSDPSAPAGVGVAPVFDVRGRLGEIHVPALILVGRKDFVCSAAMAQIMAAGIPGSRLVILEKSGHMGHVEEPATFAQAIRDFAAALP